MAAPFERRSGFRVRAFALPLVLTIPTEIDGRTPERAKQRCARRVATWTIRLDEMVRRRRHGSTPWQPNRRRCAFVCACEEWLNTVRLTFQFPIGQVRIGHIPLLRQAVWGKETAGVGAAIPPAIGGFDNATPACDGRSLCGMRVTFENRRRRSRPSQHGAIDRERVCISEHTRIFLSGQAPLVPAC